MKFSPLGWPKYTVRTSFESLRTSVTIHGAFRWSPRNHDFQARLAQIRHRLEEDHVLARGICAPVLRGAR